MLAVLTQGVILHEIHCIKGLIKVMVCPSGHNFAALPSPRCVYRKSPLIRPRRISRVSSEGKRAEPERERERQERKSLWGRVRVSVTATGCQEGWKCAFVIPSWQMSILGVASIKTLSPCFTKSVQSGASGHSLGFEEEDLGSSPGLVGCYYSYLLPKQTGGTTQSLIFKT